MLKASLASFLTLKLVKLPHSDDPETNRHLLNAAHEGNVAQTEDMLKMQAWPDFQDVGGRQGERRYRTGKSPSSSPDVFVPYVFVPQRR